MDPVTLENALEKKCKNQTWLAWIMFLTCSPITFIAAHLSSYVFLGGNPSFFCDIPELVEANWTKEQIREISNPGLAKQSCVHYAWNYSLFKDLGFIEALSYFNKTQKPDVTKCKNYIYDEETFHETIVSEWNLVCDDLPLRSTAQGSIAIGKLFGAVVFGMISDRYGRKKTFIFSCIMLMVAGPSAAFVESYTVFIIIRLLIGVACSGLFETSYTILLELTVKNYRAYLANIFNVGYSLGLMYLSLAAYLTVNWRQLQLVISVPMVAFTFLGCFLPESPRWLVASGKQYKASNILGSVARIVPKESAKSSSQHFEGSSDSCWKKFSFFIKDYFTLFSTFELTKRILIFNYLWFMGNLYYFVIALSGSNFDLNQYLYIVLNAVVEIPGFLLPLLLLTYFGRKSSGIGLWFGSGIAMLVTIVLPQGWPIMCVSLFGRLMGTAAYGVAMFHTIELFPTEKRNTAIGSCLTIAQFGVLLAPYIVDILGKKFWWIPTTLCGSLALLGAFFLFFLPETRNTPMLDTIKEMSTQESEALCKVSEPIS
ncbi:organic cation transporter protein [Halyomorpha halys]|uniref:organic cation transporter protein n=1 Tax=Halyomorpha halys TaxID=286706 RepID=UPI0006D527CA|nr:organic cation transporter protein-like [Halyomorpha halys]XP_014271353.1 organic cation transporter protein-like [Halyomorpha halys]